MPTPTVAATLDDVYKTLSPEPLQDPADLDAYYQEGLNKVRGGSRIAHMALGLRRVHASGTFYKAVFTGHPGVGKTTELTRLVTHPDIAAKFQPIRFSVLSDLDPSSFTPFDVVLMMMIRLVEETQKPVSEGGAGKAPSEALLNDVLAWFATEKVTRTETSHAGLEASAGAGVKEGSPLGALLGFFASLKGEVKYASDRKKEVEEKQLRCIGSLIDLVNRLLDECNGLLNATANKSWLFIGDDFEKSGISVTQTQDLFLNYANIFQNLRTHLIFTVPVALVYSGRTAQMPFAQDHIHTLPDTPVFRQDHSVHVEGRAALQNVLLARVSPDLFEENQMDRLIVASGGNLRDLFALVGRASDNAILRESAGKVNAGDASDAITLLPVSYERALGESPFDREFGPPVPYEAKATLLLNVYDGKESARIASAVLHALLRARAVQEFNGTAWFGVHPLVMAILARQFPDRLGPGENGKIPGAAE